MKKLLLILVGILFIGLISASDLGTFKQNDCIELSQYCDDCTYVNITSIKEPTSTIVHINSPMTQIVSDFNYSYCNTSEIGDYSYTVCGDKGGTYNCENIGFDISKTGNEKLLSGEGNILVIGIIIILTISIIFFILGLKANNKTFAIIFFGICFLFIFISSLFTMSLIENILYQYINIVEGYATFLMVIKVLVTISMLTLLIYSGLVALKLWKIKRGFMD